ncbi:carboxypeptidase B-like [Scaptodrosophila lebanonensis]|uniref:Carboxypeptidase B-like n=1 Tax=Drosophila lebanonensis TaxID=7225 RepID=A0A6J2TYX9_DROLE|nr:carboxypeptidase B-like [Scaptodrosophila lebanonensis]
MTYLWLLLSNLCLVLVSSSVYDGYKELELATKSRSAVENFRFAELARNDSFHGLYNKRGLGASARSTEETFAKLLDTIGISYRLVNGDVGLTLGREIPYEGGLSTERYYTHSEINQYLEDLAKRFPTRVFIKAAGKSYEGRWMKTITITNGDQRTNKNVIFIDGGIHAREWIAPAAALYAISELVENFVAYHELLLDYDWVVLPVVNPDGYEYTQLSPDTRLWRKTRQPSSAECIGSDPNRNFDFHWNEGGSSSDPCSDTYGGPQALSEPEVVVLRDLLHTFSGRGKMYLTLHSYGNLILYPWGWTPDLPETVDDLHEVATAGSEAIYAATGTKYEIGSSTNVLYVAAGASDDYAFHAGFPISFTMELPAGGPNDFDPPPSAIDSIVKETWVGIVAMAHKVVEKYPLE